MTTSSKAQAYTQPLVERSRALPDRVPPTREMVMKAILQVFRCDQDNLTWRDPTQPEQGFAS